MHRDGSHNCVIISLWFLVAWPYRLNHLKESNHHKFLFVLQYSELQVVTHVHTVLIVQTLDMCVSDKK
jgi:accessory gene regulator protein AgrB